MHKIRKLCIWGLSESVYNVHLISGFQSRFVFPIIWQKFGRLEEHRHNLKTNIKTRKNTQETAAVLPQQSARMTQCSSSLQKILNLCWSTTIGRLISIILLINKKNISIKLLINKKMAQIHCEFSSGVLNHATLETYNFTKRPPGI